MGSWRVGVSLCTYCALAVTSALSSSSLLPPAPTQRPSKRHTLPAQSGLSPLDLSTTRSLRLPLGTFPRPVHPIRAIHSNRRLPTPSIPSTPATCRDPAQAKDVAVAHFSPQQPTSHNITSQYDNTTSQYNLAL
ncbi:hypothetical protein F5Y14DRAFT_296038 [Nemania sp. NC0429]|nr:hypothetical protein F5Y14DRAFT_296038 [Nemania sp. NC0429]